MNGLLRWRRVALAVLQAGIAASSLIIAYLLRFDFSVPAAEFPALQKAFWIAIVTKVVVFRLIKFDRGWMRYVSLFDLYQALRANIAGSGIFILCTVAAGVHGMPRSIYPLDFLVCFLLLGAARCSVRLYYEAIATEFTTRDSAKGILIYGAGAAGITLLRELRANRSCGYRAIGFLDDNPAKRSQTIMGVPVLGSGRDAARIVSCGPRKREQIDEIVIAMPSASGRQMREALANCRVAGVPCKTIPGVHDLLSGKVLSRQIRNVSVLDLLGRDPVSLDESMIRSSITGRSVMITGAAGSIGSELCRQVARFRPKCLIAFEQAESDLFKIHRELLQRFPDIEVVPQIGDIRDRDRVEEVIRKQGVESIFHAAAYKHVPMMESHAIEAVRNNILGTCNVALAAESNGVSDFLMISSDKAVNPTNIMGATKRIAELVIGSLPLPSEGGRTKFVSVRFGNVLGSNGSVIPLFTEQIEAGGPVTITHPDMRRYFMTIPEAVQLVLQASTMGKGSEIFVLDMGEPVGIVDLARNMIRLSGHEPDTDIEIRFTGLRPGEKLFEELITKGEHIVPTYHEKIKIFSGPRLSRQAVETFRRQLEARLAMRDEQAVIDQLRDLVPEYQPADRPQPSSSRPGRSLAARVATAQVGV